MLRMKRDAAMVRRDVAEMRRAIAAEKGEGSRWDFKSAAGGLIDIEFIAQYLQLVHAASRPEILDANTGRVLEKAQSLGLLDTADSELLRGAWQLYPISRRFCGSAYQGRSIRRRRGPDCSRCSRARRACRISRRSMRT